MKTFQICIAVLVTCLVVSCGRSKIETETSTMRIYRYEYHCVLELDDKLKITSGSPDLLNQALARGAELKIETIFRHDEHMDLDSPIKDHVLEVSEFPESIIVDGRWSASFMTIRQPANVPHGFGPRASLSLFMYNQDGTQAIARPYLDGGPVTGTKGLYEPYAYSGHNRMHYLSCFDRGTNAPSDNFIYEFDSFRYLVCDRYCLLCSFNKNGDLLAGNKEALWEAVRSGSDIRVGITGICSELPSAQPYDHTLYVRAAFLYHYQESGLLVAETHPFVRVAPDIPLRYASDNWDYCWAIVRTDGECSVMRMDPYTLDFTETKNRYSISWYGSL